jgi:hypothetical protein
MKSIKNPQAALTLPGGVLITVIVKQKNSIQINIGYDAQSPFTMTILGKVKHKPCPACPQMIITNGQQQSLTC